MAEQAEVNRPDSPARIQNLPAPLFLDAAGKAKSGAWPGSIRIWMASSAGISVSCRRPLSQSCRGRSPNSLARNSTSAPQNHWLRYYGQNGPLGPHELWLCLLRAKKLFAADRIVFIGTQPKHSAPNNAPGLIYKALYPLDYEASGGVEILLTSFLPNLINGDWLRRPGAAD